MDFKNEFELVNSYLDQGLIPYKSELNVSKLKIHREFEIICKRGLFRFDLFFINEIEKRYDILEFKNRPLEIKDAYQVFKYMKAFYENFAYSKSFEKDYKVCFHLIGKDTDDERLANLFLMDASNFRIHSFYNSNQGIDVYELDTDFAISTWI